ncbi:MULTISPECIES: restriction endonuclease subunit S [Acinetobacter]|jgi:type I restriction enzyme S subunit|uniref:restriction endonuclease subunit S n=1 Tax=Acinetobacter TaxID=469 RepID=UPI0002CE5A8A|nr:MULTISPECIES: restriction endonuclease subunit S [Acinetobacter]ENW29476.1 hypothetical protein F924_00766 [Acinetobacter lwoffii ATCC 9957 = CIP 70.31]ENX31764.1 hypothetical protein F890_00704 [Acinetobacter sp. CIP 64.7]
MAKYQKYAEYKDSGVEWLGEIPSHWATCSLSKLFAIKAGGDVDLKNFSEDRSEEYPYPIYTNANNENSIYGYSKVANYQANSITVSGRGEVGFSVYRDHPFDAIIRLLVLTPQKECHPKFYAYYINEVINFRVESSAIGQLSTLQISPYKTVLPAIDEQKLIISFLDYETAKIDNLIAKQKKLIELLKEKRQAVISHAVTKGLNPNVPMKDSGVEWLGKVPEHWEVRQLRYLGSCQNGINIGAEYFGSGSPFISYGDVYRNPELPSVFEGLVQSTENDKRIYSVQRGDVLFTRTSETIEEIGFSSTCLTDVKDATFAGFLIRFRPIQNTLLPEYSKFYFRNILLRAFFVKEMNLVTRASLSQELLKKLAVPFSSLEEQKQIADFLSAKERVFDKLVNDCIKQIELLKERRTALISSAVTGKINVSNWQHPNEAKTELSL